MKINAHRPSHRTRWLLIKHKVLTPKEFLLFEYYIDQMDFDSRHKNIGTFEVDFIKLALLLGYSTKHPMNALKNKHKKLLSLGFIHETNKKNVFTIHNHMIYVASTKKWNGKATEFYYQSKNQSLKNIIHLLASNVQLKEHKVQLNERNIQKNEQNDVDLLKENTPRYLISSKVSNLPNVNCEDNKLQRNWNDAQQIYKKNNVFKDLGFEEAKWLDDHITADGRVIS